jgi:hypothetical protein
MTAFHAIALSPGSCDANGDNNHAQCAVTNTPTTFSFLALPFGPHADVRGHVQGHQDSSPNDNTQTVPVGN